MPQEPRIPSNRMPPFVPRRTGLIGWLMLSAIGIGLISLCVWRPMVILVYLVLAAVIWVLHIFENRRQQRIASQRHGESICTFARQFDCRATDTWVVRAVFEELTLLVHFPIRAQDRLEDDLKIDSEDIPEIAEAIAQRTGRPLENCESNPLYGKLNTVGELVDFFIHQPRRLLDRQTSPR